MKIVEFDRKQLEGIFRMAESNLLSETNIRWLSYDVDFICLNRLDLFDLVKNEAIVYCIWVSNGAQSIPVYIGHSTSKLSRQRITNHFIKKDPRTGSQLERIKVAVMEGKQVGLSFLKIEPDYMRKPLEEWMISRNREKLIWNIHGKGKLI
ncbi:hypothetical protein [Pararhodonellum marinum]|uniref:hypothetical protein n=1 Tax=Pararhodonellum marinum TaxID=2755358 RepID=UPI00188E32AA|nr:hypothetical protein [Pararhodonellum marinum]